MNSSDACLFGTCAYTCPLGIHVKMSVHVLISFVCAVLQTYIEELHVTINRITKMGTRVCTCTCRYRHKIFSL